MMVTLQTYILLRLVPFCLMKKESGYLWVNGMVMKTFGCGVVIVSIVILLDCNQ